MKPKALKELTKLDPDNLFVVQHKQLPSMFIHNILGRPQWKDGFEGCAIFNECNVERLTRYDHFGTMEVHSLAEFSKLMPIYIDFPKGHPLHNENIAVRTINGPANIRDLINNKHK